MASPSRYSGISLIGEMPWGTHVCLFYETKSDFVDTVVPYLKAGLESKEYCLWTVSEPVTEGEARNALSRAVPALERHLAAGDIEIVSVRDLCLEGDRFDLQKMMNAWTQKLSGALAKGYVGMRASGNPLRFDGDQWQDFCRYEHDLDKFLAGKRMTMLCTYRVEESRSVDVLDVVRAHQFTLARRKGRWDFIETPQHRQSKQELTLEMVRNSSGLSSLRDVIAMRIDKLTERECQVLRLVVNGNSNKQIAKILGLGQRTVEAHRARVMRKLGARSLAELIRLMIVGAPNHNAGGPVDGARAVS
jgi:DNA-binding CsgD family transcriptional regulator